MDGRLRHRGWSLATAVTALILVLGAAAPAQAQLSRLRGLLPGGSFSVDGKKGPLMATLDPAHIAGRIVAEDASGMRFEGSNMASYEGLRLRMPLTEAAVNEMISRMDRPWPYDRPTLITSLIIASPFYSPEAKPDGSITVPLGLFVQAESDDEVAMILAHEMGHVRLGHFADDAGFRNKRRLGTLIGNLYAQSIVLSETRLVQQGEEYEFSIEDRRRVEEERRHAAARNAQVRELMTLFFERAWARNQEDEADALAFDLMVANEMAATGASEAMFGRMNADYDLKAEATRELMDGLNYTLRTAVTQQTVGAALNGDAGGVWQTLKSPLQSAARDRLLRVARSYFDQRHRTPEARNNGLRTYSERAHPEAGLPEFQTAWLTRVRANAEYREAIIVLDALREADRLEAAGDIAGALAAMAPTRETRYRTAPAVVNNKARLTGISGNIAEADRLYTAAHASPDQSQAAYVEHVQLMVDNQRYTRALQVVTLAKAAAGAGVESEKPFLPALVALYFRQNKDAEGMPYLQKCLRYEEDAFRQSCVAAALNLRDNGTPPTPEQQARIDAVMRDAEAQMAVGATDIDGLIRSFGSLFGGTNP